MEALKDACDTQQIYYKNDNELANYLVRFQRMAPSSDPNAASSPFKSALERLKKRDKWLDQKMALKLYIHSVAVSLC